MRLRPTGPPTPVERRATLRAYGSPPLAGAQRLTEHLDVVAARHVERHGANPRDQRVDAERLPLRRLLAHLVDGADEPAVAERGEVDALEHSGRTIACHLLEAAREVTLLLA